MTDIYNRKSEKENRRELRSSMPKPEVWLWARLKGRQLLGCKFRRQYSVESFVLDFYAPEVKLGIELDGHRHYQEEAREYDERRRTFVEAFGITIVRFGNWEVYDNLDGVVEAIGREVAGLRAAAGAGARSGGARSARSRRTPHPP